MPIWLKKQIQKCKILAIDEISRLSTLSPEQVQSILAGNGGQ